MNLADLKKPFPVEQVSFRIGSRTQDKSKGIGLAFLDARDVMGRLDEVCGPENWQALYPHANGKTSCKIGIRIGGIAMAGSDIVSAYEWVWKENGAGDSDIEGEKGAFSDAFKRAAVLWGIGRYLYDMPNVWVPLDNDGKKFAASAMKQLQTALAALSNGQKPMIRESSKANVRMVSEINQLKTPPECDAWYEQNKRELADLTEDQRNEVDEQWENKKKSTEDGTAKPGSWKWENVLAQDEWIEKAKVVFDRCDTVDEVNAKQESVQHKINTLEMKRKMTVIDYIAKRKVDINRAAQATEQLKAG